MYWDTAYNFTTGSKGRSISDTGYYADFLKFNGTDSFKLQLEKGEKIHLDAHISKGKVDFRFAKAGEKMGINIKNITDEETDFTAYETGRYTVTIKAKHAKGEIKVSFDENRKDKTVYNTSF